jgi:hypothetical protein
VIADPAAPVRAELREGIGDDGAPLRLVVDPVALAALAAARADGGRPAEFGALPALDELPLMHVALTIRVELIEQVLGIAHERR